MKADTVARELYWLLNKGSSDSYGTFVAKGAYWYNYLCGIEPITNVMELDCVSMDVGKIQNGLSWFVRQRGDCRVAQLQYWDSQIRAAFKVEFNDTSSMFMVFHRKKEINGSNLVYFDKMVGYNPDTLLKQATKAYDKSNEVTDLYVMLMELEYNRQDLTDKTVAKALGVLRDRGAGQLQRAERHYVNMYNKSNWYRDIAEILAKMGR